MMKSIALLFLSFFACTSVFAAGTADGFRVQEIRIDDNGKGFVMFDQALTGERAACAGAFPKHLAFDTATSGGKSILSLALTAYSTQSKILARGTGDCGHMGVVESWKSGLLIKE